MTQTPIEPEPSDSFGWRTGGTAWNVSRLGTAAASITSPGTPAAYGTAFDLAQAQSMTAEQFMEFARSLADIAQRPAIDLAERNIPSDQHARELAIAQNYEETGYSVESFRNEGDDDEGWFERRGNDILTTASKAGNLFGGGLLEAGEIIGINEDEAPDYETYAAKNGALTESEWNSFSPRTRNELFDRVNVAGGVSQVASLPGIEQGLAAVNRAYQTTTTGVSMAARVSSGVWAPVIAGRQSGSMALPDLSSLGMWFDGSEWANSWRAATDKDSPLSLGNALVNGILSPVVSQDTLDEWRKHNSWYQIFSVGSEFAVAWYADAGVLALKGAGNVRRIARNEMPLREDSSMYAAIREAQQGREIISVRSAPAKRWAAYRAERTLEGFNGLMDYAKASDFRQFAQLPAFHGRAADGVAAAKAIHISANSGDDKLIELTRGALNGDNRALRTIQEMKEDPSKAAKYVDGTNFVEAYDAVKLKANQLEEEILKLEGRRDGDNLRHFARWELDTDVTLKQQELSDMQSWLDADSDYKDWLDSIGTSSTKDSVTNSVDPFNPQLERYDAPKTKWNDVEERFELASYRRFMPDIFSKHHTKIHVPPAIMARRIGVVSMHDLDSGSRGVERFFSQVESVLDFVDSDRAARTDFANRWANAPDNYSRYKVMYDMEETVLIPALAGKLGISEQVARVVFNKINQERNRTFEGLTNGKGRLYDSAPTFAQRIQDEASATARMVKPADDNGMVTLEFRDGQRLVTAEVPEGMLSPRVKPVDPTQTPNFYQPADVRRLYYQMKQHKDTLDELDAGFLRRDGANLAEVNEILATKFYSFWKPMQLWRLGWPQRVLMDEGFRAMAIFGPMYWITGPGAESVRTAAHNTPAAIRDKYRASKNGKVVLTDGPTAPNNRAKDAFAWQQEAATSVRVPAQHFPPVNKDRRARAENVSVVAGRAVIARDKARAIARETGGAYDPTPFDGAIDGHPLMRSIANGEGIYDPITGRQAVKGHFVPLPNLGKKIEGEWPVRDNNLLRWYEQNAELLSRRGIRVRVTGDEIEIGRWFNSKERRRADEAMKEVARSKPIGQQTAKATNITDGEDWELLELDTPDESTFPEIDEDALASRAESDIERAESGEIESIADAMADFDLTIDTPPTRKDFGTGRAHFRSHGRDYYVDDVFEGHTGRLTRALTSSAPAMDNLTDAHTSSLGILRHQGAGHVRIHAPKFTPEVLKVGTKAHRQAVLYFQRWADLLNNQVGNSPVWGPMLKGARDEDVVRYLLEDPKGHKHRAEILEPHESVEMYVNEMRAKLDYYLPNAELRRRLAKGPINASDLRRKVHNDNLPDIYGPDLTLEDKGFLRTVADNVWNALGTIPADKFSRQPFAKAVYNQKVRSLINQSDADFLNEAALERIHTMAANHTREQIRQHLFDLSDTSNLTDALRFIAPFWGAQEEAIKKWAKIISDHPETVARFMAGQRAIYNNMIVLDEENQEVKMNRSGASFFDIGFGYHPSDKMVLQVPDVVRKGPLGKALENIGSIGIPIGSANTVLQGETPLLPSFGPWMTIPADKFMRAWSDTHGTEYKDNAMYRWLFPIGRPTGGAKGILEQILPGWGRRALGAAGAEDDVAHANLYMQMAREMTLRNRRLGLPDPTPQQVDAAADMLWNARMVTSFASPVQLEFRPINQMFADEAHRYKREYGADWQTKFFEEFGEEAMIYAISSSHSLAGVPPTSAGITGWDAHKELIAKHPDLGGLIVGSDTYLDEFNHDVYEMQFEKNLGPGDSRTLRDVTDPLEREKQAEESIGWLKFRKIDATVQAELSARGLTNIQQSEADDVQRWRTEQVEQLKREYPAWGLAYAPTNPYEIYQKVDALTEIALRPEFDNRVDMQGLRNYLAIRDQVTAELDAGYAGEYASRNLQAQENYALRDWFYNEVGMLIQSNPAFGELYARYLSQDRLEQGSGGYGE